MRKGIILAGGKGTRLYPVTSSISKQILPVYDKPMIYYPLSVLMLAGIREILIISTPDDLPLFQKLLGNGSSWGIHLEYKAQEKPEGLAQAFLIAEEFLNGNNCAMILGDNIFYGNEFTETLQKANKQKSGATIFAYQVTDPERYGVIQFDPYMNPLRIVEKPKTHISKYAVTGLYFYDNNVVQYAKDLKPSCRNELEITDLNQRYLDEAGLHVEILRRGMAWLDTGTFESLLQASLFVETVQNRQDLKIACLEEVAYRMGFIEIDRIKESISHLGENSYKKYLIKLVEDIHENS